MIEQIFEISDVHGSVLTIGSNYGATYKQALFLRNGNKDVIYLSLHDSDLDFGKLGISLTLQQSEELIAYLQSVVEYFSSNGVSK